MNAETSRVSAEEGVVRKSHIKIHVDLQRWFSYTTRTMFSGRLSLGGLFRSVLLGVTIGVLSPNAVDAASQLSDAQLQVEVDYATQLIYLGFSDYSERYLADIVKKYNVDPTTLISVRVSVLASQKRFKDAEAEIDKAPAGEKRDGLYLTLADSYYMWGKYKEAKEIYAKFFAKFPSPPPDNVKTFYLNSVYKYIQMLMLMGESEAAIGAYDMMIKAKPEGPVLRQAQSEKAELCVKFAEQIYDTRRADAERFLKMAWKLSEDIQWKGIDIWFGKSIVVMAHVYKIRGEAEKASGIVKDKNYFEILKNIDDSLREEDLLRYSPMAQCRYMIGDIMETEGRKLAATDPAAAIKALGESLQHFINVFFNYPASPWAVECGKRAEALKSYIEGELGRPIKIPPIPMGPVMDAQFKIARTHFLNQSYEQAIESYNSVLAAFPEAPQSVKGLGQVTESYIYLNKFEEAEVVMSYLSERFGANKELQEAGGKALVQIADVYSSVGKPDLAKRTYDAFFQGYPDHKDVPVTLFKFGDVAFSQDAWQQASEYYEKIITTHTNSHLYLTAYSKYATCYSKMKDAKKELEVLSVYVQKLPKSAALITTKYRIADAYAKMKSDDPYQTKTNLLVALRGYAEIQRLVAKEPNPYVATADDRKTVTEIKRLSTFRTGYCFAKLKDPGNPALQVAARKKAIGSYETYLKLFPNADPKANPRDPEPLVLSYLVTLYTAEGETKKAQASMDALRGKYPEHDAVVNALYQTVWNLMELGQPEKALAAAEEMVANAEKYGAAKLLKIGELMLENEKYDLAYKALSRAYEMWGEKKAIERVMYNYAEAANKVGEHEEVVKVLTMLIDEHPKSYYSIPASFTIAESLSFMGGKLKESNPAKSKEYFQTAKKAMKRLYRVVGAQALSKETSAGYRAHADYVMGLISINSGSADEAMGSFQRLLMLADAKNPEVAPWYEKAFIKCLPLMKERDQTVKVNVQDLYDMAMTLMEQIRKGDAYKLAKKTRNQTRGQLISMGVSAASLASSSLDLSEPEEGEDSEKAPAPTSLAPAGTPAPAVAPAPAVSPAPAVPAASIKPAVTRPPAAPAAKTPTPAAPAAPKKGASL